MNYEYYKLCIIGKPLHQSFSPIIHTIAMKAEKLNGIFEKFELEKDDISNAIEYFKNSNYKGFTVTIPYKVEIMKYLDKIDESAQNIGAVNTVKILSDKTLVGYNTDILGFYNSVLLKRKKIKNAIIFGTGGAAKAIVYGLKMLDCERVSVYGIDRTEEFVSEMAQKTKMKFNIKQISPNITFENSDILINATPLGTIGDNENKSVVSLNSLKSLNKSVLIFDVVYNPEETLFLKYAKECNLDYMNGLNMLLLQGVEAFKIWTKKTPNIDIIRQKLLKTLK